MSQSRLSIKNSTRSRKVVWLFLALLLFVLYLLITNENGFFQLRRLGGRVAELKGEIEILEKERKELEKEKDLLLHDLDYIEKKAREEYGMLKEGEKAFDVRFVETKESERD